MDFYDHVPEYILEILSRLNTGGFDAYLAGGCVRDIISGRLPSDFDIASNAPASDIARIFSDYDIIDYGAAFGSLMISKEGRRAEITAFRTESDYSDHRRPDKIFLTDSINRDLSRRDFTINSMAWSDKGLIDPFGGEKDLLDKTIRCTGDPAERFSEDPLRILRALRFACVLGLKIEDHTKEAMHELYPLIDKISKERILSELTKMLSAKNPGLVLSGFPDIFKFIIPLSGVEKGIDLLYNLSGNPFAGFSLFLTNVREKHTLQLMRMSNKNIRLVLKFFHLKSALEEKSYLKALKACSDLGSLYIPEIRVLTGNICKDNDLQKRILESMKSGIAFLTLRELAIGGDDLIREKIAFGKDISGTLNRLNDLVLEGTLENNYGELIKTAKIIDLGS